MHDKSFEGSQLLYTKQMLHDTKKDLEHQTHLLNEDVKTLKQNKERLKVNESRLHQVQNDIQNSAVLREVLRYALWNTKWVFRKTYLNTKEKLALSSY
jgi:hypothetical protein